MKNTIDMSKSKHQQLAALLTKNQYEMFVDDLSTLTQKFTLFDIAHEVQEAYNGLEHFAQAVDTDMKGFVATVCGDADKLRKNPRLAAKNDEYGDKDFPPEFIEMLPFVRDDFDDFVNRSRDIKAGKMLRVEFSETMNSGAIAGKSKTYGSYQELAKDLNKIYSLGFTLNQTKARKGKADR